MQQRNGRLVFSATDLVTFLGCRHATFLDGGVVDGRVAPPDEVADPYLELLREKGLEHERALLARYRADGKQVTEIASDGSLEDRTAATLTAMHAGADVIYQGAFLSGSWHGYADFLIRVDGVSSLGAHHYEPLDTKLAHSAKPKHVVQLAVYADLLTAAQGREPERLHILLGTGETTTLQTADFRYYFAHARSRFKSFVNALPAQSQGFPCSACELCRWRDRCGGEWEAADHLTLVARITGAQIEKLNAAGVSTVAQLASLPADKRVERMQSDTLARLRGQAALQDAKRRDGQNHKSMLAPAEGKGFARLPKPNAGDLFFDMEGDPLLDGGLEYLFGFAWRQGEQPAFRAFWGHARAAEKTAFKAAVDFIAARLAEYPDAHVYHYADYEKSALLRLAMRHGTREAAVDDLVRRGKLVDLLKVVREAVQISEPAYSLKNIEVFYMAPRQGEVTTAGGSVVVYERWRKLRDPRLLDEIERYNETDCVSTLKLHEWLLGLRPADLPWHERPAPDADEEQRTADREATDTRIAETTAQLMRGPAGELGSRELVSHLLNFHRREAKPAWWRQFQCVDMSEEELIEDAECIGALRRDVSVAAFPKDRSMVHTFSFPPQDFKMRKGDAPRRAGTRESVGTIFSLDEQAHRLQLKAGSRIPALGNALSLIPKGPFDDEVLRDAILRYATAVIVGEERYAAVTSVLKGELPRIRGRAPGVPVLAADGDAIMGAIAAIDDLEASHLLVQGPPGSGKTYLSAAAIVELLHRGRRVGVASNSHKAINRLLEEIVKHAQAARLTFRGVKKYGRNKEEQRCNLPMIEDVTENDEVTPRHELVAGTAWLFADPQFDQSLDVLFVDEAGLVSTANLVAMGLAARNIVLVGDQMQLTQPIQGTHPGRSGFSTLEYLLEGYATVPPERGVFLEFTRRMHPDVCKFISDAVYDGRLHSFPGTELQRVVLSAGADPALKASGLSFVAVAHEDRRQKSEEEGQRVAELFASLLQQRWVDPERGERPLEVNDILVVSPYNIQVNHLQSILPAGARVGTVDKFQGQEAAVVIVSMTASSAEDVPRGMEFLYSRNRLNVAISRAKSLAIVVASPQLLEASCSKIEQMALVNTLCHAKAYADVARATHRKQDSEESI